MAVTIESVPQLFTPSDNGVDFVFSSNQSAQPNFSFVVDLYINSVLKSQHLIFPEFGGDTAHFDASEITSVVCNVPNVNPAIFNTAANNSCSVYVTVHERYGTTPILQANATSSTIITFKASLSDAEFAQWDYTEYIMNPSAKWLTLFPRTERLLCGANENLFMMFITNSDDCAIEISLYDSAGVLISSDNPSISSTGLPIMILNVSQAMLLANTVFLQSELDETAYFTIAISNTALELSEVLTVYVDTACNRYGTKRLHFLSSIGSIEGFSFTLANQESRDIQSKSFEQQLGNFDTGGNWVYDLTRGREVDFLKTSKGKLNISSDWLTEDVQAWLAFNLYNSPFVLLEKNETLFRVRVTNSSYVIRQEITDQLFQEKVELALSDNYKSSLV